MKILERAGILLIRAYRLCISPFLGANCRFHPTCSAYAIEALETHGFLRGSWLSFARICRCHPFATHGPEFFFEDPVPNVKTQNTKI
ncbi:MAG: membrane protein insertion efficiency factor YidD [Rickettsiales bacterium]|nr:membrane protein insertion efficiency factor YidD [Rickettsiales bacterium]